MFQFLQGVAVLREEASDNAKPQQRRPIKEVKYDFYSRPILRDEDSDGDWEVCNPVDGVTGLWYDGRPMQSSYNNNNRSATSRTSGADWYDLLQIFLQRGYSSALKSDVTAHPLLLVERSYNPPPIRQQVLECLFEECNVPATFLAKDAVLSCYGCGRTTGTVVDVGYSGTTVTPVYEGYVESKGIRRSPVGILQMDELILKYMDEAKATSLTAGAAEAPLTPVTSPYVMPLYQVRRPNHAQRSLPFHHAARLYLALQCREMGAGAAINTSPGFHAPHRSFELPDGTTILDIPSTHRFAVANLVYGSDPDSLQRRQEIFNKQKVDLTHLIELANQEENDGENENSKDKNILNQTEDPFSEAAAVGISKRRTNYSSASRKRSSEGRAPFSNRGLQKACASYLQTHMNEHLTMSPVASMICDAAYRCDRDQQVQLLGNVVVGGGGACLGPTDQTVPDLIREQVESIIHTHTPGWRVKVLAPGTQERAILSWLGGSILGSLGTFHEMWITKAEYEEWGTAIVNRKCP